MTAPRVSVVMPVYNREWCVAEALQSVLATNEPDLELVVVDDGSTDRTSQILAEYAQRHPSRMRVHTHPDRANRGIAASRNLGVSVSNGKYLAFLDSDDLYHPMRFMHAIPWLDRHPELAGCIEPFTVESLSSGSTGGTVKHLTEVPAQNHGWLRAMLFSNNYWNTPTLTLRREAATRYGRFDEGLRVGEDTGLWLRLAAAQVIGVAQSRESVARVRRHAQHSWASCDRSSEHGVYVHILLGLLRWLGQSPEIPGAARELVIGKLRSYLVEILSDHTLPLGFRLRMWQRAVFGCHRLFSDRWIAANVIRAPFRRHCGPVSDSGKQT